MVFPLIRRRRRLVDVREAASNVLAGHVADSIANAEAVRAFAREPDEARIHARQRRRLRRQDAALLGLPEPARRPRHVADVRRHQHARADRGARRSSGGTGASLEAVFITFSYYATATRVMWEFNRIYRNLEGALTDAAQFAELLLEPPAVVDATAPEALRPGGFRRGAARRQLPLLGRAAAAVRPSVAQDRARREDRAGRTFGRRQDDADAAAAALFGRRGGSDPRGRPADRSRAAGGASEGDRLRAAGSVDVPSKHRRQHPGRPARTRPTPRCGARRSSPTRRSSSRRCRPATRRSSASAA